MRDERASQRELENKREGAGEIQLALQEAREPETEDEDRGRLLEPITPPLSRGVAPDLELFGGETIGVRPRTSAVATILDEANSSTLRRSKQQRDTGPTFERPMITYIEEPQSLSKALGREDSMQWREAWVSEVDSLARNDTWRLEELPPGRQAIGCRWLLKRKDDGRYKARLVAKGYSQQEGVDFTDTFAPVAKFNSLRTLLALVYKNDWEQEGMDVKTAFLNSQVTEEVYMDIPVGLV